MKRVYQKFLPVLLFLCITVSIACLTANAAATSGSCGQNVTWSLNTSTYELTITGTGPMYDYVWNVGATYATNPWAKDYSKLIKKITVGEGITHIGNFAFHKLVNASVALPQSLTSIGTAAFGYCDGFVSISIPESATQIGENAFSECDNLKTITLPSTLSVISDSMFDGCDVLDSITLPNTVTSIGAGAFRNCKSLKSISLPDSVTALHNGAFRSCTSLSSVRLPSKLETMGQTVFQYCSALADIDLPDSLTFIGTASFDNTAIYNNTSNHVNGMFYVDNWLMAADDSFVGECVIKEGCVGIASFAFDFCTGLTDIVMPDSLKYMCGNSFSYCSALKSVRISNSLQVIEEYDFSYCSALTSLIIPDSVKSIGEYAFSGSGLTTLFVPAGVTEIASNANYNRKAALVIYGFYGSTAQNYAKSNGISFNSPKNLYYFKNLLSINADVQAKTITVSYGGDLNLADVMVYAALYSPDHRLMKMVALDASAPFTKTLSIPGATNLIYGGYYVKVMCMYKTTPICSVVTLSKADLPSVPSFPI